MRYFKPPVLETQRKPLLPKDIISGSLPGATQIRVGGDENILIDGLNKRITVTTSGGTSGVGTIPGSNESGFFSQNADGDLVMKIVLGTLYFYDIANGSVNKLRLGEMPDSTYNMVIAKDGIDVDDLFP